MPTLPARTGADEKRDAPSPGVQTRRAHRIDGEQRDADRKQSPDLTGGGGERGDQATPVARRALKQIGDDRDIFAADRKSHDAAQEKKKRAGRRARLRVRGQQGRAEHRHRHQRDRQEHRATPPEPIADIAKNEAAQRAQQIGDCECRQSCAQRGFAGAEKHPRKHGGEVEVEGEVVPFHHRREGRDGDRGARHGLLRRLKSVIRGRNSQRVSRSPGRRRRAGVASIRTEARPHQTAGAGAPSSRARIAFDGERPSGSLAISVITRRRNMRAGRCRGRFQRTLTPTRHRPCRQRRRLPRRQSSPLGRDAIDPLIVALRVHVPGDLAASAK